MNFNTIQKENDLVNVTEELLNIVNSSKNVDTDVLTFNIKQQIRKSKLMDNYYKVKKEVIENTLFQIKDFYTVGVSDVVLEDLIVELEEVNSPSSVKMYVPVRNIKDVFYCAEELDLDAEKGNIDPKEALRKLNSKETIYLEEINALIKSYLHSEELNGVQYKFNKELVESQVFYLKNVYVEETRSNMPIDITMLLENVTDKDSMEILFSAKAFCSLLEKITIN